MYRLNQSDKQAIVLVTHYVPRRSIGEDYDLPYPAPLIRPFCPASPNWDVRSKTPLSASDSRNEDELEDFGSQ